MDIKEYCETLDMDVSVWRRQIAEVESALEQLPDREKNNIALELQKLSKLSADMDRKIAGLKDECPGEHTGKQAQKGPEAHDCIMKMNVWDSAHILPEDM